MTIETKRQTPDILRDLEAQLIKAHGVVLDAEALKKVFKFRTAEAFSKAEKAGALGVPIFRIPHRTGCFALACDVAARFANLRERQRLQNGLRVGTPEEDEGFPKDDFEK